MADTNERSFLEDFELEEHADTGGTSYFWVHKKRDPLLPVAIPEKGFIPPRAFIPAGPSIPSGPSIPGR